MTVIPIIQSKTHVRGQYFTILSLLRLYLLLISVDLILPLQVSQLQELLWKMLLFFLLPSLTSSVPFLPLNVEPIPSFGLVNLESVPLSPARSEKAGEVVIQSDGTKVCLSESCVKTAARLINQMDRTADPCQDFYQFACGGFLEKTVLPEHKSRLGSYDLLRDELNLKLRALFEADSDESEPRIYGDVRRLYRSCMDTERIEKESVGKLVELVDRLGGWPVVEGDQWTCAPLRDTVIKSSSSGLVGN